MMRDAAALSMVSVDGERANASPSSRLGGWRRGAAAALT